MNLTSSKKYLSPLLAICSIMAVMASNSAASPNVGYLLSGCDVNVYTTETPQALQPFFDTFKTKLVSVNASDNSVNTASKKPQCKLYIYDLEKASLPVSLDVNTDVAEKSVMLYTRQDQDGTWDCVISAPNSQLLMSQLRRFSKEGLASLEASETGAVLHSTAPRPLTIVSTESAEYVANWVAAQPAVSSPMRDWTYVSINDASKDVNDDTDVLSLLDISKMNDESRKSLAKYLPVSVLPKVAAMTGKDVVSAVQQPSASGACTYYCVAAKDKTMLSNALKRFTYAETLPKVLTSYPRLMIGKVAKLSANGMPDWSKLPQTVLSNWKHQGAGTPLTGMRLGYDSQWLYMRIDCEDSGTKTWMARDEMNLWEQDVAEMFVDAGCDEMDYYEFEWNPLGAKIDLEIVWAPDGRWRGSREWDAKGMKNTTRWGKVMVNGTEKKGWVTEIKIPLTVFSDRKAMPKSGDVWLGGLYRIERDTPSGSAYLTWADLPGSSIAFHQPRSFGFMQFE